MLTIARKNWVEVKDGKRIVHKNDIYLVPYTGADGKTHYSLAACADLDAYAQTIEAVVETMRGELQLDTAAGIPYFETIFASTRYIDQWAAAVRRAVLAKSFVQSIDDFTYNFNPSTGTLSYKLDLTTDLGDLVVSQ